MLPTTDHPLAVYDSPDPGDVKRSPREIYRDILRQVAPDAEITGVHRRPTMQVAMPTQATQADQPPRR